MADRSAAIPGLLVWLASVGSAVLVSLALGGPDAPPADAAPPPARDEPALTELRARLAELQHEFAEFEHELAELRLTRAGDAAGRDAAGSASPRALVTPAEDRSAAGWERRLARLEAFEQARQQVLADRAAASAEKQEAIERAQAERRDAARATILDPASSDSEKAHAFRDLRGLGAPWTDDVLLAAIDVAETSDDDRAREVVWIGADTEQRSDLLVGPLMRALANDRVADVREEAADALKRYLDVPGVRQALHQASLHDGSDEVRQQALAILAADG